MELLIVANAAGTHADVFIAREQGSVPAGMHGRVIGPGESFMDVPYWVWRGHVGQTVDVLLARTAAPATPPDPARTPTAGRKPAVRIPIGQVLDTAFQLIRRAPLLLAAIAVVLQIPVSYLAATITRPVSTVEALRAALLFPWTILGTSVLILLLAQAYHGARPDLRRAADTFRRRAGVAIGASLLTGLLVGVGTALALVPGMILSCLLFAVPAVAVLEARGPANTVARAWRLAMGAGWSLFLTVVVLEIFGYLVRWSVEPLERAGGVLASASVGVAFAGGAFRTVLSAAVITSVYYALRVAREGYDIELLVDGPDTPAPAAATA